MNGMLPELFDPSSRLEAPDGTVIDCYHPSVTANMISFKTDEQVRQERKWDCGAAAAMSVGLHFGVGPESLDEWAEALGVEEGRDGTPAHPDAIAGFLHSLGLHASAVHGMSVALLAHLTDEGSPVLCPIQHLPGDDPDASDDARGHWVVVLGVEDGEITFHDPGAALGTASIPQEEWEAIWHDVDEDGEQYDRFGIAVSAPETPLTNCRPGQMRGADGRCGPGISEGVSGADMPQIKTDDLEHFLGWVTVQGAPPEEVEVRAGDLSPTQDEFRQERVDALPEEALEQPILISEDLYVLDGTHRWVRHWQRDEDGLVPAWMLPLPLHDALDLMRRYPRSEMAENAFCPTGEGGGQDNTCPPRGAGGDAGARPPRPEGGFRDREHVAEHAAAMVAAHGADPHVAKLRAALSERQVGEAAQHAAVRASHVSQFRAELDKLAVAKASVAEAREALARESRRSMVLAFSTPHGEKPELYTEDMDRYDRGARNKSVQDAQDYLRDLGTADALGDRARVWTGYAKGGRAFYQASTVRMAKGDGPDVVLHEWGHHLEEDAAVRAHVQEFSARRFGDEPFHDMADASPKSGYARGEEKGRKDRMDAVFGHDEVGVERSYYAGKTYSNGRSEIVSMGLEQLHRDPVHFAKADPEYFALIVHVIQGKREGNK